MAPRVLVRAGRDTGFRSPWHRDQHATAHLLLISLVLEAAGAGPWPLGGKKKMNHSETEFGYSLSGGVERKQSVLSKCNPGEMVHFLPLLLRKKEVRGGNLFLLKYSLGQGMSKPLQ